MSSHDRYCLTSSELAVELVPEEGGRIASIRSLLSGVEFLSQSHRQEAEFNPSLHASFQNGPCAGIEECLPTVGPSGPETIGGAVPDHGDFWQFAWTVDHASERKLTQSAKGFSRPLRFQKSVELNANRIRLSYSIQNVGGMPQSFLYACHPLFAVMPGDAIFLPNEIDSLRLDFSRANRLGEKGDSVSWPVTENGLRLDLAGAKTDGTAEMFYTEKLKDGSFRIYRAASKQSLEVHFEVGALPYLGIWLCYGGWPDEDCHDRQYAVALEPTTSPHNTLDEAQQDGTAIWIQPQESFQFQIFLIVE